MFGGCFGSPLKSQHSTRGRQQRCRSAANPKPLGEVRAEPALLQGIILDTKSFHVPKQKSSHSWLQGPRGGQQKCCRVLQAERSQGQQTQPYCELHTHTATPKAASHRPLLGTLQEFGTGTVRWCSRAVTQWSKGEVGGGEQLTTTIPASRNSI